MVIILLLVVAAIGAAVLVSGNTSEKVMDAYCTLECKERKIRDYSICC